MQKGRLSNGTAKPKFWKDNFFSLPQAKIDNTIKSIEYKIKFGLDLADWHIANETWFAYCHLEYHRKKMHAKFQRSHSLPRVFHPCSTFKYIMRMDEINPVWFPQVGLCASLCRRSARLSPSLMLLTPWRQ